MQVARPGLQAEVGLQQVQLVIGDGVEARQGGQSSCKSPQPYLSRRFKEKAGETLTDFILKEKTEEAKRLLRYADKPLTAIGAYLGFSSASHFSRVFKAYVGTTPREYREKHQ